MPKSSQSDPSPEDSPPPFEEALAQLEELVSDMESEQVPLEELISNFESGTRLFQICSEHLEAAEGRIEVIRKSRSGETVVEPFDSEANPTPNTTDSSDKTTEETPDDNGELF